MRRLLAGAAAAAGLALAAPAANAAVIAVSLPRTLSAVPVSFTLGTTATFSFTLDTSSFAPAADISTAGTAMVSTIFGGVADFGAGSPIDGTGLFTFAAYPTATIIPNSQADDFVGLSYAAVDGTHYGYAEVFGGSLVGYGYETTAGRTILTGSPSTPLAVPEPATLGLLAIGCIGVCSTGLWRRRGTGLA